MGWPPSPNDSRTPLRKRHQALKEAYRAEWENYHRPEITRETVEQALRMMAETITSKHPRNKEERSMLSVPRRWIMI